jgi:hypothetical protein
VEQATREHLATAEINRNLARSLLDSTIAPLLPTLPYQWATVIAFYAAVHYVNAYLWERYRIEPRNHGERGWHVRHDPILRNCEAAYGRLQDAGYRSRYVPLYQIARSQSESLLNVDLAHVEAVVSAAL